MRQLIDDLRTDVGFALRGAAARPLLALVIVATLAIGIGVSSGVFTLFDAAVFTPHIAADPASFAQLYVSSTIDRARPGRPGYATLDEYRALASARRLSSLVATRRFVVRAGPDAVPVDLLLVTCNFFAANGAGPAVIGRLLETGDCDHSSPVAVLDEALWRANFGGSPSILGSALTLNGRAVTVVGIAPHATGQFNDSELWVPYTLRRHLNLGVDAERASNGDEGDRWLSLWGRLAPGSTRASAAAELAVLAAQYDRAHPERTTTVLVTNGSFAADPTKPLVMPLVALVMSALGCLLLITCANAATLLLARADARQRDVAIRLSLGGTRWRLLRMLVAETMLLAIAAGGASVYLAHEVPILLFKWFGGGRPAYSIAPDWRAFAYLGGLTLIAGVAAGLTPALESLRVDVLDALKGRRSGVGVGGTLFRNALIAVQIALSFVLLVGAGLFAMTHYRIVTGEPGFESSHLLIARATTTPGGFTEALGGLPGVRGIAFCSSAPVFAPQHAIVSLADGSKRETDLNEVSPGFLNVIGLPMLRGRGLDAGDQPCATGTCNVVVSEAFVRQRLPDGDPLGTTLTHDGSTMTIVGVARDSAAQVIGQPDPPVVYVPWTSAAARYQAVVRFDGDATAFSVEAGNALRRHFPGIATDARTGRWYVDAWIEEIGPVETLILALGAAAAALGIMGVYGIVSFTVSRGRRDIAIRLALGARARDIHADVVGNAVRPAMTGLLAGVALSLGIAAAFSNVLQKLHFAVSPTDPLTYGLVAALLMAVVLGALAVPARRAAHVDPMAALKCDG